MNVRDEWAALSNRGRGIIDAYQAKSISPAQAYRSSIQTATQIQQFLQDKGDALDAMDPALVNSIGLIFDRLIEIANTTQKQGGLASPVAAFTESLAKDTVSFGKFAIPTAIVAALVGVAATFLLARGSK